MPTTSANTVNQIKLQLNTYFQQLAEADAPPVDALNTLPELSDMSSMLTSEMRETLLKEDAPEYQVIQVLQLLNEAAKTYNALLMARSTREDALTTFKNSAVEITEDGE